MLRTVVPEIYDRNIPFFGDEDRRFLEDVYEVCEREIARRRAQFRNRSAYTSGDGGTITVVRENLVKIIEELQLCQGSKNRFLKKFPSFRDTRNKNTDSLEEIGNSIHWDRRNSNISRLVAHSTSFTGGLLGVFSAVLIPITLGLTAPLVVAGGTMAVLGSATAVGTSITESVLLRNKVERAKAIIVKDKEEFEDLASWLIHASALSKALEDISNISIMRNIMDNARQFVSRAKEIKNGKKKEAIELFVKSVMPLLSDEHSKSNLESVGGMLISMLVSIILLHDRNRLIFDCASLTFKSVLAILSSLNYTVDTATMVARVVSRNPSVGKNVGMAVARGAFAMLAMSLDAASILLTSIDFHNGSVSEQGEMIIQVSGKLREEVNILQKVFDSLK